MATARGDGPITLSLIDRLIDAEPKQSAEVPPTRAQSIRDLRIAVRRDLEWLLNSRQPVVPVPDEAVELRRSIYNYGLPDITSANLVSVEGRTRLVRAVEMAVHRFEPRLANVRVTLNSVATEKSPQVRFTIEGLLRIDPAPEPVLFDTVLEIANGEYKVQG
jgi:type VI secretion system protein ImpF